MPETIRRGGLVHLVTRLLHGPEESLSTPERETPALHVTTHVARDLLQNAAYFNSVPKAVTEYVTNAIDNPPPGQPVHCEVTLTRKAIRIADDASGMTYTELSNFFQMHGENVQRKRGRAVRGKFGTGKSAAFGIANTLRIETVKDGKRNVVVRRPSAVIYLNCDHPQLRIAEAEAGIESLTFKMLSFDIAFTAYALAVVSQLADQGLEVADPIDASEMTQQILDRLGRKAADHFAFPEGAAPSAAEEILLEESAETNGAGVDAHDSKAPV